MNQNTFNDLLEQRLESIKKTLYDKGKEYSRGFNVFHNFIQAGKKLNCSKEKALMGMMTKHLVSIDDLVNTAESDDIIKEETVREKIGDTINYLILLEAMLLDREETILSNKQENEKVF